MKIRNFIFENVSNVEQKLQELRGHLNGEVAYVVDMTTGNEYVISGMVIKRLAKHNIDEALDSVIDRKIYEATKNLATKEEATPLSSTQVEQLKNEIISKLTSEADGSLKISYEYATPIVRIKAPNGNIEQGEFTKVDSSTYRYEFNPESLGNGNYTLEFCVG